MTAATDQRAEGAGEASDLSVVLPAPFAEVLERTRAALAQHGFGVVTEIDMQATFQEKLGERTEAYVILGACQPRSAFRATRAQPEIGLLLPCNVAVYEQADGGVRVSAVDPVALFGSAVEAPELGDLAGAVRGDLAAAIDELRP